MATGSLVDLLRAWSVRILLECFLVLLNSCDGLNDVADSCNIKSVHVRWGMLSGSGHIVLYATICQPNQQKPFVAIMFLAVGY